MRTHVPVPRVGRGQRVALLAAFLLSFFAFGANAQTELIYWDEINTEYTSFPLQGNAHNSNISGTQNYSGLIPDDDGRNFWYNRNAATSVNTANCPYLSINVSLARPTKLTRFVLGGYAADMGTRAELRWSRDNFSTSLGSFSYAGYYSVTSVVLPAANNELPAGDLEFRIYVYNSQHYYALFATSGSQPGYNTNGDNTPASFIPDWGHTIAIFGDAPPVCSSTSSVTSRSICSFELPYTWNGQSIQAGGTYSAQLTNAGGCDSTATLHLSVSNCTLSYPGTPFCTAGGTAAPQATLTPGNSFTATPAGLSINAATGVIDLSASAAGTYTVRYGNGSSGLTTTVQVGLPVLAPLPNRTYCDGQTVSGLSFGGQRYEWIVRGGTAIGMNANDTTGTGTELPAFIARNGAMQQVSAQVSVKPLASGGCPQRASDFLIRVSPAPQATIVSGGSQSLCAGATTTPITLQANMASGVTYRWTNSATAIGAAAYGSTAAEIAPFVAQNNTGAPSVSGTFTVTPFLGTCAGTPVAANVTVHSAANGLTYPGGPAFCGGTLTPRVSGSTGGTYTYSNLSNGTNSGLKLHPVTGVVDASGSTPGNYRITYTLPATGGSCPLVAFTDITISAGVSINAPSNLRVCAGMPATMTFSSPQDGQANLTYTWSIGGVRGSDAALLGVALSGTGNTVTLTPQNPTGAPLYANVSVRVSADNAANLCPSRTATFSLTVNPCGPIAVQASGTGGNTVRTRSQAAAAPAAEATMTVAPNPAQGSTTLFLGDRQGDYTVQLLTQQGLLIGRPRAVNGNRHTVDLSGLASGVYLLQVSDRIRGTVAYKQVVKL